MSSNRSAFRGLLAGAIGGAVATIAMDLFQEASLETTRKAEDISANDHRYTKQQEDQLTHYEEVHVRTATFLAQATVKQPLTAKQRKTAAPLTHYAFGTLCGGVYGLLAEYWHPATFGFGTAFGTSLFLGASESVLPALGLMPAPTETPAALHAGGFAAHALYGAATESVRRLIRQA